MQQVTGLKILWLAIIQSLVPAHAFVGQGVDYMEFVKSLRRVDNRNNNRAIYKHHMPTSTSSASTSSASTSSAYSSASSISASSISASNSSPRDSSPRDNNLPYASSQIMDSLYGNKKRLLEKCYYFFDTDGDGLISAVEFHAGCKTLNELGKEAAAKATAEQAAAGTNATETVVAYELKEIDEMLDLMDFNHSGEIDINEFFEAFRLASRISMPTDS